MMVLAGMDIASTSGLAVDDGRNPPVTMTWRAPAKRSAMLDSGAIDYAAHGKNCAAFYDFVVSFAIEYGVQRAAIEQPLRTNITFTETIVDESALFAGQAIQRVHKGGTQMSTVMRLYGLFSAATMALASRNIPYDVVNQRAWRSKFLPKCIAPHAHPNPSEWFKKEARRECERRGIKVTSDDAAEACGVLHWLREKLEPGYLDQANSLFRGLAPTTLR